MTKSAPVERLAPVEGRHDFGRASESRRQLLRGAAGDVESLGIDVVQHDAQGRQVVETEQVGEQLAGEHDASRAEENNLRHGDIVR